MKCMNCLAEVEVVHRRGGYWCCDYCAELADTPPHLRGAR